MKYALLIIAIAVALFGSIILDRFVGTYVTRTGYFKAMMPLTTEIYDTSEYYSVATISAQGLRDGLVTLPKPSSVYRVLALGDSFTFGMGVTLRESWPKIVEASLSGILKNVEVVNAGMISAMLSDESKICSVYAHYLEANALVVGLYMDDLYQAWEQKKLVFSLPTRLWPTFTRLNEPVIGFVRWPTGKSGDTVYAQDSWKRSARENVDKSPEILLRLAPKLREDFLNGRLSPAVVGFSLVTPGYLTYILNEKNRQEALEAVSTDLKDLGNCAGRIPKLLVFLPSEELVSSDYFPYKKDLHYDVDDRLVTIDLDSFLKPIAESNGFTYLSLLTDFRSDGCPDCFYPYDGHFNAVGHRRVAVLVSEALKKIIEK